jgi:hypothetical protein
MNGGITSGQRREGENKMSDEIPNPVPRFVYDDVLRELAEARECLIEAMDWSKSTPLEAPCQWRRWRKAAGLEETE